MTREEAKDFLTDISYDLGTMRMEYLSVNDGEKVREAIETLEQEPFKPMVEIDLYSVVKSYIEREVQEVLDKIRTEIIELRSKQNVGVLECLDIIDKYKTESE